LKNYLAINYAAALPEPDAVEKIIYKFIPPDYTKSEATFNADLESSGTKKFIPPGKKISSYRTLPSKGKTKSEHFLTSTRWERCTDDQMEDEQDVIYELWAANWKSPGFREYHRRMQILVLFYIEGGSYIEEDDDRWEFVVL
jgi:histone acetyltransferase 1